MATPSKPYFVTPDLPMHCFLCKYRTTDTCRPENIMEAKIKNSGCQKFSFEELEYQRNHWEGIWSSII